MSLENFNLDAIKTVRNETIENINTHRAVIDFEKDWLSNFFKNVENENMITMKNVVIPKSGTIRVMQEPSNFMEIFKSCKTTEEADKTFREFIEGSKYLQTFEYKHSTKDKWFNSTLKGINLRPGFVREGDSYDVEKCSPVLLGDDVVHTKIAGRTGGGKSVLLNDIICTMMYEYAPWWLDIWLADFKLVEMSRYGNRIPAPHVSVIAATETMEFVVSAMYEMYMRMSMRQAFFTKLGVQKLADFYKKYDIILPQVVLIADEFQQMFELATGKQAQVIEKLIKMITKLGRATGFHLGFASQSMSGTVSGDVLSNFKAGIALPCDDSVSSAIIGNGSAKDLVGKGKCIVNEGSGAVEDNRHYAVPFLNSDEDKNGDSALVRVLREMRESTDKVGFKRDLKFYSDDYLRPLEALDNGLENILEQLTTAKKSDTELDDLLVLGDTALFKNGKDLEVVPIKKADKQNILVCGDGLEQKAYLLKLLATQWKYKNHVNFLLNKDTGLAKLYNIEEDLEFKSIFRKSMDLEAIQSEVDLRKVLYEYNIYPNKTEKGLFTYLMENVVSENLSYIEPDMENYEEIVDMIYDMYKKGIDSEDEIEKYFNTEKPLALIQSVDSKSITKLIEDCTISFGIVGFYMEEYKGYADSELNLCEDKIPQYNFWVVGADKAEELMEDGNRLYSKFEALMKTCTNYKIRFILCCSTVKEIVSVAKMCSHILIKSENEDNYTKFAMDKKSYDEQYYRYKNRFENVNKFKGGMEVIPNDEKLFKCFDVLFEEKEEVDFLANLNW